MRAAPGATPSSHAFSAIFASTSSGRDSTSPRIEPKISASSKALCSCGVSCCPLSASASTLAQIADVVGGGLAVAKASASANTVSISPIALLAQLRRRQALIAALAAAPRTASLLSGAMK